MMGWFSEEFPATTLAINEYTLGRIVAALKGAFVFIFRHPCFQCAIVHCAFRPQSTPRACYRRVSRTYPETGWAPQLISRHLHRWPAKAWVAAAVLAAASRWASSRAALRVVAARRVRASEAAPPASDCPADSPAAAPSAGPV